MFNDVNIFNLFIFLDGTISVASLTSLYRFFNNCTAVKTNSSHSKQNKINQLYRRASTQLRTNAT